MLEIFDDVESDFLELGWKGRDRFLMLVFMIVGFDCVSLVWGERLELCKFLFDILIFWRGVLDMMLVDGRSIFVRWFDDL